MHHPTGATRTACILFVLLMVLAASGIAPQRASTAVGPTWTFEGLGGDGMIFSMVYHPPSERLYVVTKHRFLRFDGGTSWTDLTPPGLELFTDLAYSDHDGGIYCSCSGGVYRFDGSSTWDQVAGPEHSWKLAYNIADHCLYASKGKVWRYDGAAWSDVSRAHMSAEDIFFNTPDGRIYVSLRDNLGILRYDGGTNWTGVRSDGFDPGKTYHLGSDTTDGILYASHYYPASTARFELFRYNGGADWTDIADKNLSPAWCIGFNPLESKLYAGCSRGVDQVKYDGRVYRYDGDLEWTDMRCPGNSLPREMVFNPSDSTLYVGFDNGSVFGLKSDSSWMDTSCPAGRSICSLAYHAAEGVTYAGCDDGHVFRSGCDGWLDTGFTGSAYAKGLVFNPADSSVYAGGSSGHVFKYILGEGWTDLGFTGGHCAYVLAFNDADDKVYAGCQCTSVLSEEPGHVFRYDGDSIWTDVGRVVGSTSANEVITDLCFSPEDDRMFAATDFVICKDDGGMSWTPISSSGTPDMEFNPSDRKLYAVSGHDVTRYDGGFSWTQSGLPTGNWAPRELAFDRTVSKLFCGCLRNRVFIYNGGTMWCEMAQPEVSGITAMTANQRSRKLYIADKNGAWSYSHPHPPPPRPVIASVCPRRSVNGVKLTITIRGSGFQRTPRINIGRAGKWIKATSIKVISASMLRCTFDLRWAAPGSWDLFLRNPDGQGTSLSPALEVIKSRHRHWSGWGSLILR